MKEERIKRGVDKKKRNTKQKGSANEKIKKQAKQGGQKTKKQGKKPLMVGKKEENKNKVFTRWQQNLPTPIRFTQPHQMATEMDLVTTVEWRPKWIQLPPCEATFSPSTPGSTR